MRTGGQTYRQTDGRTWEVTAQLSRKPMTKCLVLHHFSFRLYYSQHGVPAGAGPDSVRPPVTRLGRNCGCANADFTGPRLYHLALKINPASSCSLVGPDTIIWR